MTACRAELAEDRNVPVAQPRLLGTAAAAALSGNVRDRPRCGLVRCTRPAASPTENLAQLFAKSEIMGYTFSYSRVVNLALAGSGRETKSEGAGLRAFKEGPERGRDFLFGFAVTH